jgi:hypothetical protein
VVFPEGTSSLGPKHLPFKSGAARIALEACSRGIPVNVVPLGITYNAPAKFRSSVEIVVGEPLEHGHIEESEGGLCLAQTKTSLTRSLESVGINVDSVEYFEQLEALANMVLPDRCSFRAMKFCEPGIPESLCSSWNSLRTHLKAQGLTHGTAAKPFTGMAPWLSLCAALALAPVVSIGALLNCLPLAGAYWAGRKLSDAPNVITLWRILVGAPLFALWFVGVFAALAVMGKAAWFLLFTLFTVIASLTYAALRQFLVAGWNGVRLPELRREYLQFRRTFLNELDKHESSAN